MNKKLITLTVGAGLAAGSFAGLVAVPAISGAQSTSSTAATAPADQGRPDPSARFTDTLKPLVDNGTITQSQADAVIAALIANGPKDGMRGGKGGPGLDVAAQALGMTVDELHTALDGGQTLAQVAESKGVSVQVLTDALVASHTNHINEDLAAGKIDQAKADELLANVNQHVTDEINGVRPQGAPQGGPQGGRGHGPKGQAPAQQGSPTTTN